MIFTVAIDGPAGAGKGTIARALAERFGLAHLDTGLLYRAVGRRTLDRLGRVESDAAVAIARALEPDDLARPDLRTPEASRAASEVAAIAQVRASLVAFQRAFARRPGGAVLDGRDIATAICPEAEVKLYVTASPETRARRRASEWPGSDLAQVLAEIHARDERDRTRADAPLTRAPDAHLLDTTDLSIERGIAQAAAIVAQSLDRHQG